MALGDSITAGFGINGIEGGLLEVRGHSYAIGGDTNAVTLANFLKFYSPDIQGASLGNHLLEYCGGNNCSALFPYEPKSDVLNAAVSGAEVDTLYSHELDYLLEQLHKNSKINMTSDWKLLTIWIGANDLCGSCGNTSTFDYMLPADNFESELRRVLEKVRTNIPRTFVNLIETFNISQVYTLGLTAPWCKEIHRIFPSECPCIFHNGTVGNLYRTQVDRMGQEYNMRLQKIAKDYASKGYPEFAVVSQPPGRDAAISKFPASYLSDLDCFHPGLLAHQLFTAGIWNSMLLPAAKKPTSMVPGNTPILCPTADTVFYTN